MSPVHDGYGKKDLESADHRVQMCRLATSSSPLIMVDGREAKHPAYQRTRQVLEYVEADLDHHFSDENGHLTTKVRLLQLLTSTVLGTTILRVIRRYLIIEDTIQHLHTFGGTDWNRKHV